MFHKFLFIFILFSFVSCTHENAAYPCTSMDYNEYKEVNLPKVNLRMKYPTTYIVDSSTFKDVYILADSSNLFQDKTIIHISPMKEKEVVLKKLYLNDKKKLESEKKLLGSGFFVIEEKVFYWLDVKEKELLILYVYMKNDNINTLATFSLTNGAERNNICTTLGMLIGSI